MAQQHIFSQRRVYNIQIYDFFHSILILQKEKMNNSLQTTMASISTKMEASLFRLQLNMFKFEDKYTEIKKSVSLELRKIQRARTQETGLSNSSRKRIKQLQKQEDYCLQLLEATKKVHQDFQKSQSPPQHLHKPKAMKTNKKSTILKKTYLLNVLKEQQIQRSPPRKLLVPFRLEDISSIKKIKPQKSTSKKDNSFFNFREDREQIQAQEQQQPQNKESRIKRVFLGRKKSKPFIPSVQHVQNYQPRKLMKPKSESHKHDLSKMKGPKKN